VRLGVAIQLGFRQAHGLKTMKKHKGMAACAQDPFVTFWASTRDLTGAGHTLVLCAAPQFARYAGPLPPRIDGLLGVNSFLSPYRDFSPAWAIVSTT
jgi:hypothetical protein